MKRTPFLLALSLIVASCATMQSSHQSLVSRAVEAEGAPARSAPSRRSP